MSEIDNLLNELRNMKSDPKNNLLNNKETWSKVGQGDFQGLGFSSREELNQWILANPYSNI